MKLRIFGIRVNVSDDMILQAVAKAHGKNLSTSGRTVLLALAKGEVPQALQEEWAKDLLTYRVKSREE